VPTVDLSFGPIVMVKMPVIVYVFVQGNVPPPWRLVLTVDSTNVAEYGPVYVFLPELTSVAPAHPHRRLAASRRHVRMDSFVRGTRSSVTSEGTRLTRSTVRS
jgi:hypothetical protein